MQPFPPAAPPHGPDLTDLTTTRAPRRRRMAVVLVGITVVVSLASAGLLMATVDRGVDHPSEWDPRVAKLTDFIEGARGLDFRHPVYVDFLTPEEYTAQATTAEAEVGDEERAELDRYAGELRALGVASGEIDLFEAFNQVSDSGTLAFYDPADQRVRVRGTEMTVGLEVTLVHELTHALQDQHFDLERLYEEDVDSGAATAFRGLVEGDAVRIENSYIEGVLTEQEQLDYETEYDEQLADSEEATSDVPPFVNATFGIPYALGQPLVTLLDNQGGNGAVDDAFLSPPDTEEHLFDPASFLAPEGSEEVDPGLADDIEVLDDGPFGSPSWYLVLVERIDPELAFRAALGWDGDAFASFERDGRSCIRAVFAGDTADDEAEMAEAIDAWVAAMPGERAEAVDSDGHPGLEACDPGTELDLELTGRSEQALFVPSLWGYLVADAATVLDADGARCYAARVLEGLTFEEITDPEGAAFQGEEFQQQLMEAFEACDT